MDYEHAIATTIIDNPERPGPANARLIPFGIPVWALIGYLKAVDGDVEQTAADYLIPVELVEIARAYYARHREAIDARLVAKSADVV